MTENRKRKLPRDKELLAKLSEATGLSPATIMKNVRLLEKRLGEPKEELSKIQSETNSSREMKFNREQRLREKSQ